MDFLLTPSLHYDNSMFSVAWTKSMALICLYHWKPGVVIIPILSSLVTPDLVVIPHVCDSNSNRLFKYLVQAKHDGVTKWKLFSALLAFVRGIHWSSVICLHKGSVMRNLMFLWCGSAEAVKQTVGWTDDLRLREIHVTSSSAQLDSYQEESVMRKNVSYHIIVTERKPVRSCRFNSLRPGDAYMRL